MIKKFFLVFTLMGIFFLSLDLKTQSIQQKIDSIFDAYQHKTSIKEQDLPPPYHHLLTQPLMTKGIATYYQRTPTIERLYSEKNQKNKTYYRVIRMLVAKKIVELAFITMNFKELPKPIRAKIQNTNIPFGQLLLDNNIQITNKNRNYFTIKCNKELKDLIQCPLNTKLYGRTNTIIQANTDTWLARVIEILSGMEQSSKLSK